MTNEELKKVIAWLEMRKRDAEENEFEESEEFCLGEFCALNDVIKKLKMYDK